MIFRILIIFLIGNGALWAAEQTANLPIVLTTPEQAQTWSNFSGRIKAIQAEANDRVAAAQKEAAELKALHDQRMSEALEGVRRSMAVEYAAKIARIESQYSADKAQIETTLSNDFAEREQSATMKRFRRYMAATGLGGAALLYTIVSARRELSQISRAMHQDDIINWKHEASLSSIKKMPEKDMATQVIASYFSSPDVIKRASPATPIDRVLQAVNERICQLQTYIGWQGSNALTRWLVGFDIRMVPIAQERLVRLIIMRDVLTGYDV